MPLKRFKILAELRAQGIERDTFVVFPSANGRNTSAALQRVADGRLGVVPKWKE